MGIQLAFIATRSGLLRYSDYSHLFITEEERRRKERRRKQQKKKGIEEVEEP